MPRAPSTTTNNGHISGLDLESSGSGFLTKTQVAILDAALLAKQQSGSLGRANSHTEETITAVPASPSKSRSSEPKTKAERAHDRHNLGSRSRTDKGLGRAKKGGAGGKYVWGSTMDEEYYPRYQDRNDPNYDSADEQQHAVSLQTKLSVQINIFKEAVVSIIREFYNSGDMQEASKALMDLDEPDFGHFFVKKAITLALDMHDREREMASALLAAMYTHAISPQQMEKGYLNTVQSVDDLKLDVPAAVELLGTFVARAISDEVLPPSFLNSISSVAGATESEVRLKADLLLRAPHHSERLTRCWGAGAGLSFNKTKESIATLLQEYLDSGDTAEVCTCLNRIGLPVVHHELVKQAVRLALEKPGCKLRLMQLLQQWARDGTISESQLLAGFQRVKDNLPDTELDNPSAKSDFEGLQRQAQMEGWLPDASQAQQNGHLHTLDHAAMTHSLQAFKAAAMAAIKEYYMSADSSEVVRRLAELDEPGFHNIFLKLAIQLAIDAKDKERELTAKLLAELYPHCLSEDQVALGFTRLLACAEDMMLDSPDAPHQLALFLGRVIVDELLPPAFLTTVLHSLTNKSMGVSIVQATGKMLMARHATERLMACWHCGTRSIEALRANIQALVQEYLLSQDADEAARCWREMDVAFFAHQLVFSILVTAFETPDKADQLMLLLDRLAASGEVSQTQMRKGFERVQGQLEDLALDYPSSTSQFETCKARGLEGGWLVTP